jgi:hypothetical protein
LLHEPVAFNEGAQSFCGTDVGQDGILRADWQLLAIGANVRAI